jgi:hypothetical protein
MSEPEEPSEGGGQGKFVPTEQRQEEDKQRRSGEDRREDEGSFEGEEKRAPSDRRETSDRRSMGFEVPCKTSGTIDVIEDWLDEHCFGDWQVVLRKVDDDMATKHLMVMFETESDKNLFLGRYLQRNE